MHQIFGIPVPSGEQIIVGLELVIILYVPKKLLGQLDSAIRQERNRIIHKHVKTGHRGRLKQCLDAECLSLRTMPPASLPMAESELADLEQ